MERQFFQLQMRRLSTTYGERLYPTERLELIWRAFQNFPDFEFEAAIAECIGNHRSAPMVDDLNSVLSQIKRDRPGKRIHGDPIANEFNRLASSETRMDPDFIKMAQEILLKKREGKMNREQFSEACDYLDNWAHAEDSKNGMKTCRDCFNTGYVSRDLYAFRCYCQFGDLRPEIILGPDKNGERERCKIKRFKKYKESQSPDWIHK
jgi:hypothetical protein